MREKKSSLQDEHFSFFSNLSNQGSLSLGPESDPEFCSEITQFLAINLVLAFLFKWLEM
jgi:hypothetical protein